MKIIYSIIVIIILIIFGIISFKYYFSISTQDALFSANIGIDMDILKQQQENFDNNTPAQPEIIGSENCFNEKIDNDQGPEGFDYDPYKLFPLQDL